MRAAIFVLLLTGCGCNGGNVQAPKEMRTVDKVKATIAERAALAKTFKAETLSDYWLGNNRIKGTVKIMGTPDRKVRFNGLSPAGGSVLLDLMCDGTNFVLIDYQNNCQLTGPCTGDSIAQLLRVPLEPEDFFALAVGQTPVLADSTGRVTWDSKHGHEVVELESAAGKQTIVLDARQKQYDVVRSEMRGANGAMIWSVENKEFGELASEETPPVTLRVPGKSRFRSPAKNSDVIVEWNERVLNAQLPPVAFQLTVPPGLPTCGGGAPAAAAPGGAPPAGGGGGGPAPAPTP
jgi:hypothetical protein